MGIIWDYVLGVFTNATCDFIKSVGWESAVTFLTGFAQKIKRGSLDWWILSFLFVLSLFCFYISSQSRVKTQPQSVAGVSTEEKGQGLPRTFTKDQQTKLFELLNKVPDGVEHVIAIEAVNDCRSCVRFAENLRSEWQKVPGWKITHMDGTPADRNLVGLRIAFRSDCTGEGIRLIIEALKSLELISSDVSPYTDEERKFPFRPSCSIFVGNPS